MVQFNNNIDLSSLSSAREAAVGFIGISKKSSGRVRDHLLRKGFSSDLCDSVVAGLIEDGFIDDERVARAILVSRRGAKSEGRFRLRARMIERGVPENTAESVLAMSPADSDTITELLRSTYKSDGPIELSRDEYRPAVTKASRFLVSRGYSYDLISYALSNFFKQVE